MEDSEYILQLIREVCGDDAVQDLTLDTRLRDLHIDSMKMIQIVFELETCFDIEIEEHRLFQLDTVGGLLDLVQETRINAVLASA